MFIEIDGSVASASGLDVREALEVLGLASVYGHHFVTATPAALRSAIAAHGPRGRAFEGLKRASGGAREVTMSALLPVWIRAEGGLDYPVQQTTGAGTVLRVPVEHFASGRALRPSVLIGENYWDTSLLLAMGKAYLAAQPLKNIQLSLDEVLGGGSTTAAVYDRHQSDVTPCLVVVDSDRGYPGAPEGDVAQAVRAVDDQARLHAAYRVLPVRSSENAVPHALIEDPASSDPGVRDALDQHRRIALSSSADVLAWTDMKGGTPLALTDPGLTDANTAAYWATHRSTLTADLGTTAVPARCSGGCSVGAIRECECVAVRGFGPKLLERLGSSFQETGGHGLLKNLDARTEPVWMDIGGWVAAWGLARRPLQV